LPVALRKYGIDLHKKVRRYDLDFAKAVRLTFRELEDVLSGTSARVVQDIFANQRENPAVWKAKQRTYLSYYQTAINSFYDRVAVRVRLHQKQGFFLGFIEFRKVLNALYPKRYRKFKESIDISEQDKLEFNFTFRGEVNDSFKQHLADQLDAGIEPGSLIKTISPDHVKYVQSTVLSTIDQGISHAETVDALIGKLAGNVTNSLIRKQMEYNIMRIARTSYQQAVNAEMVSFCQANSAVVDEMERVADGRPCVLCCPSGTLITMENGLTKSIETILLDDRVVTHSQETGVVSNIMERSVSENLIKIVVNGKCLYLTSEHPVMTISGWVKAGELHKTDLVLYNG